MIKFRSYSFIPALNIPVTLKSFALGIIPNGVVIPSARLRLTISPIDTSRYSANSDPRIALKLSCWISSKLP